MKTVSAALTVLFLGASLMLAPTGWAQTSAPPASQTAPKATDQPSSPSGSVTTPPSGSGTSTAPAPPGTSTAPARPGSPGAPGTAPGTATDPAGPRGDTTVADDGTIFGMSRTAAIILGLVVLGIIVALVSMSRRDRDIVETRTDRDLRVYDRERDVLDDRDRPRKVS
jgi:hypothetical protein